MDNNLIVAIGAGIVALGMLLFLSINREIVIMPEPPPVVEAFHVATLDDLTQFPAIAQSVGATEQALYAVRFPENDLVVILRPLTQSEFGSFQIQSIAIQLIEWQMLAATIVFPTIDEIDVLDLPPDLVKVLKETINEISGFDVFDLL